MKYLPAHRLFFLRSLCLGLALIASACLYALEPFDSPDAIIQEAQEEKQAYLKSIDPIKDHVAVRFVGIKMNQASISVRTILRQPKEEIFIEDSLGKTVECTWESETGKSLYVRFANDRVRFISLKGYTQEEVERYRQINDAMEKFAQKDIEAQRYKRILARNHWTFSDKPFEGKLVGWKEGQPLFRVQVNDEGRIQSKVINFFPQQDRQSILFYRDYNFQRSGKDKAELPTFEMQPKKK